ncbi:hypothetical protein Ahia01_000290800, partial [Argonauta hians]
LIIDEHHDCVMRAQRLAASRRTFPETCSPTIMQVEDLLIFLRSNIYFLHSVKRFQQYMDVMQWLPFTHMHIFAERNKAMKQGSGFQFSEKINLLDETQKKDPSVKPGFDTFLKFQYEQRTYGMPPKKNPTETLADLYNHKIYGLSSGGVASDFKNLGVPIHCLSFNAYKEDLKTLFCIYNITYDIDSAPIVEEIEIYGESLKKFNKQFNIQKIAKTFKPYESRRLLEEKWGLDKPKLLLKTANWLQFITLEPTKNVEQEKKWTALRQKHYIDTLLQHQSNLMKLSDPKKILNVLKCHISVAAKDNLKGGPASSSLKQFEKTEEIWQKVYSSTKAQTEKPSATNPDASPLTPKSRTSLNSQSSRYDFTSMMRLLGFDEGLGEEGYSPTKYSGYTAYLLLRILRIRDLQISCLNNINYMRSIERTLTIYDGGLALKEGKLIKDSEQNHKFSQMKYGTVGSTGGLNDNESFYNTPADAKIAETNFIEHCNIENIEDFYEINGDNIYVQDQEGYNIIYDIAVDDFKKLEEDLLILGSLYIDSDKCFRRNFKFRKSESFKLPDNFKIPDYSQMHVDRYGILFDLWTQEAAFQKCKRNLIRCYFEAYINVFDRDLKQLLAQIIINIIYQRPRHVFQDDYYFIQLYYSECINLQLKIDLIQTILNQMIKDDRAYTEKCCQSNLFGMPRPIIEKTLISIHTNQSSLLPMYLLEFHPILCVAIQVPAITNALVNEMSSIIRPENNTGLLNIERTMLEIAIAEWNSMGDIDAVYSSHCQSHIFFENFIEDPFMINRLVSMTDNNEDATDETYLNDQTSIINRIKYVLEVILVRFRLIMCCWECSILEKLYKTQIQVLSLDENHLNIRKVTFDEAIYREGTGTLVPGHLHFSLDESRVIRVSANDITLSIFNYYDIDPTYFSFATLNNISRMLCETGLKNLRIALKCQLCHRYILTAAILQLNSGNTESTIFVAPTKQLNKKFPQNKNESWENVDESVQEKPSKHIYHESFLSVQFIKTPLRDKMLNGYLKEMNQQSETVSCQDIHEIKLKCLSKMFDELIDNVRLYMMRVQIILLYKSIHQSLENYPSIRNSYFSRGIYTLSVGSQYFDLQVQNSEFKPDAPGTVMSENGKKVENIFYLPHCIEVYSMFNKLSDKDCSEALNNTMQIASLLNDILKYLIGHHQLGNRRTLIYSPKHSDSTVSWGGLEGIKTELTEIMSLLKKLPSPSNPYQVIDFLEARRDIVYLEFDIAVRSTIRETFLLSGNKAAYDAVKLNQALLLLSNAQIPTGVNTVFKVPEPLEPRDKQAMLWYPRRSFLGCYGSFIKQYIDMHPLDRYMQICLVNLTSADKLIANGEILGVSVQTEDVINAEFPGFKRYAENLCPMWKTTVSEFVKENILKKEMKQSKVDLNTQQLVPLGGLPLRTNPTHMQRMVEVEVSLLDIYKVAVYYLTLWKQLEVLKHCWYESSSFPSTENPLTDYQEFSKIYRKKILFPAIQSLEDKNNKKSGSSLNIIETVGSSRTVSEFNVKGNQIIKLLERFECHMIELTLKQVNKNLSLAISEYSQDHLGLPVDLWKKPDIKSIFYPITPNIIANFKSVLLSKPVAISSKNITFSRAHLNECLVMLAQNATAHDKLSYQSYTSHFESLMKTYMNKLSYREQEIKKLKNEITQTSDSISAEVEYLMSEKVFSLIMQMTSFNAAIINIVKDQGVYTNIIRGEIRREYNSLVEDFFSASLHLKKRFEEFRYSITEDVLDIIASVRKSTCKEMENIKKAYDLPAGKNIICQYELEPQLKHVDEIRELNSENNLLNVLILKLRAINVWHRNYTESNYLKAVNTLIKEIENLKKANFEMKICATEESKLLKEQLVALREQLYFLVKDCNFWKHKLTTELGEKQRNMFLVQRNDKLQQQMEQAAKLQITQLEEELMKKDNELKVLAEHYDRILNKSEEKNDFTERNVAAVMKALQEERVLKQQAFHRIDILRHQVSKDL